MHKLQANAKNNKISTLKETFEKQNKRNKSTNLVVLNSNEFKVDARVT